MKTTKNQAMMAILFSVFAVIFLSTDNAYPHCDTLDGPVVAEARTALTLGDVTPLLKWVLAEEEENIRVAFKHTLAVRKLSDEAKELADMYFFETLVRIHRAGEGAPYTGLKPGEAIDPAVALADKALESGSVDKLVDVLTKAMANGIRERFQQTSESQKYAENSVAEGRQYTKAYVIFTHYIEQLHGLIAGKHGEH